MSLSSSEKHLLRLARKDPDPDGWVACGKMLWPYVAALPGDLIELRPAENGEGGHVRLTDRGDAVATYA